MDIGAILKAPTEDKDWLKKCGFIGLFMLIPIVGALNAVGWMKAVFDARRRGDSELPKPGLEYVGDGFWYAVSMLPAIGALLVIQIGGTLFAAILPRALAGIFALGFGLISFLVAVAFAALMPAAQYIYLTEGDRLASIRFKRMLEIAKTNVGVYAMLWVSILVAQFVGGLGYFACGVGILLTMPAAFVMQGAAFAMFDTEKDRVVEVSNTGWSPPGE